MATPQRAEQVEKVARAATKPSTSDEVKGMKGLHEPRSFHLFHSRQRISPARKQIKLHRRKRRTFRAKSPGAGLTTYIPRKKGMTKVYYFTLHRLRWKEAIRYFDKRTRDASSSSSSGFSASSSSLSSLDDDDDELSAIFFPM